ncbi:MAG TPA: histidine kinase [Sphingomicrobium sp.]|nr:histidine kinase [Sphingomicrobium sp.]
MTRGLQYPSARVIAIGRLMLATLFLLAIWIDITQPALAPVATYALLGAYVVFAVAMLALTWSDWWLDAKLAGPAHAVDLALFTLLVLLTEAYTSPVFTFVVFLLLSAAIRWGWAATTLTAILVTLLYLVAGLIVVPNTELFELQRFLVRTGQVVILSLILIWFGANEWRARYHRRDEEIFGRASLDESPLEIALQAAMNGVGAAAGALVWRDPDQSDVAGLAASGGEIRPVSLGGPALMHALAPSPFLYDLGKDRALRRDSERNLTHLAPLDAIAPQAASALALKHGLAIPIRSEGGEGELFLESVPNLSTDHIDLGEQIAADVAAHLQGFALLKAAEESAEARSRLGLARDLHDSVVQFLAGAAFRLEAMKRSQASGRDLQPDLNELKQLMLQEQGELRSFIAALRSGPLVAFNDLATDLKTLGRRLAQQWDVACKVSAQPTQTMIPTRLHLDAHQLMREAVANAVRHAEAKLVTVTLVAEAGELRLDFVNDGTAYPRRGERLELPSSLKERVENAGGALDMARGMGVTKVSVSLPIRGRRH